MKNATVIFFLLLLQGCNYREYYSSQEITIQSCRYNTHGGVTIQFLPVMESVYFGSGVNFKLSSDSNTAYVTFIRQHREGRKIKTDLSSNFFRNDTTIYSWVDLPYHLKKIIVTPPDSVYYINE
jgi:hypothetical protein